MGSMNAEIGIECDNCGTALNVKLVRNSILPSMAVFRVEPCPTCSFKDPEFYHEESYEQGYETGFDEGREEGYEVARRERSEELH
jgi:hypothetical protein